MVLLQRNNQIFRNSREEFCWPLTLTDPNGTVIPIVAAEMVMVAGTSTLAPPESIARHPMTVEPGLVCAMLAGPDVEPEGALVLAIGRNKPWIRVEHDGQVFWRPARAIYCVSSG